MRSPMAVGPSAVLGLFVVVTSTAAHAQLVIPSADLGLSGRYTSDSDAADGGSCPLSALTFHADGTFAANTFSDGRALPSFEGAPFSGTFGIDASASGEGLDLILATNGGAEERFGFWPFAEGPFELWSGEQAGAACIFFPNEGNTLGQSPASTTWGAACDEPCSDDARITGCHLADAHAPGCASTLCAPVQECTALVHTGPALSGAGVAALVPKVLGAFIGKPAEDDPFDGVVLRSLTLNADGTYATTDADSVADHGNWSLTARPTGPDAVLGLQSVRGAWADRNIFVRVVDADTLELQAVPNTTRVYRAAATASAVGTHDVTLAVVLDASLVQQSRLGPNVANTNYGSAPTVTAGGHPTHLSSALFGFALTAVPAGAVIEHAELVIPAPSTLVGASSEKLAVAVSIIDASVAFTESTATFNLLSDGSGKLLATTIGDAFVAAAGESQVDVTDALQGALEAGKIAIALRPETQTTIFFPSKEAGAPAHLVVRWHD